MPLKYLRYYHIVATYAGVRVYYRLSTFQHIIVFKFNITLRWKLNEVGDRENITHVNTNFMSNLEMKLTRKQMAELQIPIACRDFCAHILVPLNE